MHLKENFGLEWIGKNFAKNSVFEEVKSILKEDKEFNKDNNSENLLIKGDNLEVLKHLSKTYKNKIKMIYIDPPYNTRKKSFLYNDDKKYSNEELEKLGLNDKEIKKVLNYKSISHSAWLSFMYPRLYISRELLKDDGVIFVSIDDNEFAHLKIIMNEIFGEENFVGTLIWNTKKSAQGMITKNMIVPNHEYILVFSKNNNKFKFLGIKRDTEGFSNPDNDPRGLWKRQYLQRIGQGLPIRTIIDPKTNKKYSFETPYTQEKLDKWVQDGTIIFPTKKDGYPARKEFLNEYTNNKQLITSLGLIATKSSTEKLYNLFDGEKIFTNPKPDILIKFLLETTTKNDDIILDFFAGSGTTGDAVMQLNTEDNGKRKFILVQNPELLKTKNNTYNYFKNKLKIDNPTIFDITKERLIRAGKKLKEEIENKSKKDIVKLPLSKTTKKISEVDLGFKIFEIKYN